MDYLHFACCPLLGVALGLLISGLARHRVSIWATGLLFALLATAGGLLLPDKTLWYSLTVQHTPAYVVVALAIVVTAVLVHAVLARSRLGRTAGIIGLVLLLGAIAVGWRLGVGRTDAALVGLDKIDAVKFHKTVRPGEPVPHDPAAAQRRFIDELRVAGEKDASTMIWLGVGLVPVPLILTCAAVARRSNARA